MKILTLQRLTLVNFKGIKSLVVDFQSVTSIYGANEAGKTTLMDAFLFLLFGKDSTDRKDFEIKTLDSNGKAKEKLDHEVSGILIVDGREVEARRIYREKWTVKRGSKKEDMTGHETELFWNGVPVNLSEYQAKVNGLINESVFKLITNPLYFNSIKWQDRRNVLMEIAGEISVGEITDPLITASNKGEWADLLANINHGIVSGLTSEKALEEYRRKVAAQRKKVKDQLEMLPTRIDEATRATPEALDFDSLQVEIEAKQAEIAELDAALQNVANAQKEKNNANLARQNEIYAHQRQIQTIESEIRSLLNQDKIDRDTNVKKLRADGRAKDSELTTQRTFLSSCERKKGTLEKEMADLRADWAKVNATQPHKHDDDFTCPSCKQTLPAGTVAERKAAQEKADKTFSDNKAKRLGEITAAGQEAKKSHEATEKQITDTLAAINTLTKETEALRQSISALEAETATLDSESDQIIAAQIAQSQEINELKERIAALQAEIEASQDQEDNSEIKTRRAALTVELDALKKQYNTKEQIEKAHQRIAQLNAEESTLADQLVQQDGLEFIINQFIRAKMEAITERINSRFKYARFKLFEDQINGGQAECCETTYKGVPFSDLNTAGKILVGIDIINALSDFYKASAPIWLDNRESVSSIPDTDAQIINLIVSPADKQLRVA